MGVEVVENAVERTAILKVIVSFGNKRNKTSVKKKPPKKDVFELGHLAARLVSMRNKKAQTMKTKYLLNDVNGASARDYTLRMRKENAKAILEERKKNTKNNTKLERKRYLWHKNCEKK